MRVDAQFCPNCGERLREVSQAPRSVARGQDAFRFPRALPSTSRLLVAPTLSFVAGLSTILIALGPQSSQYLGNSIVWSISGDVTPGAAIVLGALLQRSNKRAIVGIGSILVGYFSFNLILTGAVLGSLFGFAGACIGLVGAIGVSSDFSQRPKGFQFLLGLSATLVLVYSAGPFFGLGGGILGQIETAAFLSSLGTLGVGYSWLREEGFFREEDGKEEEEVEGRRRRKKEEVRKGRVREPPSRS